MEGTEGMSSGIRVKVNEAPETYQEPARTENPSQLVGSTAAASSSSPITVPLPGTDVKKKRGRLRKYALDGSTATALSPMPISSWIPLTGEISDWKLGKERPLKSLKKQHKCDSESAGVRTAYSVGANFTPHVITVNAGEDVGMKLLSLSQQGSRAICILSANGTISNVTLHQPNSLGGTVTYEGRFELLSLMGSFMPTENGETRSQSGGMSVSLAGSDGCIIGGGISGLLVAAGPVQFPNWASAGAEAEEA